MEYLPISKINTFAFCQRRFFYEYVLHIQDVNYHVLEGRYLHEDVYAEHDEDAAVWVWSDRLGLVGVVDLIEHQAGSPIPVEYKKGRRNHFDGDALQLCAQGICIEEQRNVNVTHGYVYYHATRRRRRIDFDKKLREGVRQTVKAMRIVAGEAHAPPCRVPATKCRGCSIREHCQPELWR